MDPNSEGRLPMIPLRSKVKVCNIVKNPISVGMEPVILFWFPFIISNDFIFPIDDGRLCVRLFPSMFKCNSVLRNPISGGICPVKPIEAVLKSAEYNIC